MNLDDYPLPLPPEIYSQVMLSTAEQPAGTCFVRVYHDIDAMRAAGLRRHNMAAPIVFGPMKLEEGKALKSALVAQIKPVRRLLGWYTHYLV